MYKGKHIIKSSGGFTLQYKTKETPKSTDPMAERKFWTRVYTTVQFPGMKNGSGANLEPLSCQISTVPTQENTTT